MTCGFAGAPAGFEPAHTVEEDIPDRPRELERRLTAAGLDVEAHYYPGARHEVLNETNRDDVHRDIVTWLDTVRF